MSWSENLLCPTFSDGRNARVDQFLVAQTNMTFVIQSGEKKTTSLKVLLYFDTLLHPIESEMTMLVLCAHQR